MRNHEHAALVTNLRLKFPNEASLVFKDLSFSVSKGEKVLLLGPSGCGKSTLLQVLSGMIPNSVEIPLKYDSIQSPESWGYVFQDPDTQFCMPYIDEELAFVLENLNIPKNKMDERIEEALERVGLGELPIHTSIHSLSQGMKQRLALASVLLMEPDVLFLDEPSALLDPNGVEQIWTSVKKIAAEKTVIIVEHKIDHIAEWVDRVVLFNDEGEIITDGAPSIIFGRYRSLLIQYGIWYPEVWEDYIESSNFKKIEKNRLEEREKKGQLSDPLMKLNQFIGYRGKEEKINIQEAAVYPGSWVAITGENGAGKSTFLLALMQLLRTSGHYKLEGKAIEWNKRRKKLPEGLSLVFQNPELQFVANSIYDELSFSYQMKKMSESDIQLKVRQLLSIFQLPKNEKRHPFQLSIGQKRRLSVATAFTTGEKLLLLDEPTFGQDAKNTFTMLEQLEGLRKEGMTILMITHDERIVEHFATEVWTIERGALVDISPSTQSLEYERTERCYATTIYTT